MKTLAKAANLSGLALLFSVTAALGESAVSEAPTATLALNSGVVVTEWTEPKLIQEKSLAKNVEIDVNKSMEELTEKLNQQLQDKIARELDYAMQ